MLAKHHDKILCLLANDFSISELLENGIDYIKENYLILKLSGIAKPVEGNLKFYTGTDKLNAIFINNAKDGNLKVVKYLISQGADIHAEDDLALRWSVTNGHLKVVKYLVSQGINIHVWDDYAFRGSASNGHLETVKYLVSQGANIHARNNEALRWSANNEYFKVVKYLASKGADIYANNNEALQWSIENNHTEITKYLKSLKEKQNASKTP